MKVEGEKSEEENTASQEHEQDDDDKFYDKQKSFFDNISCEALEKAEGKSGRPDWKKERETNQETFGQSAVRTFNNYRRGFNPRGRGRGGYNQGFYFLLILYILSFQDTAVTAVLTTTIVATTVAATSSTTEMSLPRL